MFEEILLGRPERRRIVLQTRSGRDIENEIAPHPVPDYRVRVLERLIRDHAGWELRKSHTGYYNCFGHVWASRRTAVYELDEAVLKVKDDDGYRVIDLHREMPVCGDVACYWEEINPYKNFMHVGRVAGLKPRKGLPSTIFVLSKWDDTSGEFLHEPMDLPSSMKISKLEYWTDRPDPAQTRRVLQ